MIFAVIVLFLAPVLARAGYVVWQDGPQSWRDADWTSTKTLPSAQQYPGARVLVMSGRTGGWKGVVAVHSWIVLKPAGASSWTRYDVVGWGRPVRINGWAIDGRWFGHTPVVVADILGPRAEALIPKIQAAITAYPYANAGDYRVWPGPNSNTFVATVLRAVPEMNAALPPNAIGRDFRAPFYVGLTDSGTGVEANLYGLLGISSAGMRASS